MSDEKLLDSVVVLSSLAYQRQRPVMRKEPDFELRAIERLSFYVQRCIDLGATLVLSGDCVGGLSIRQALHLSEQAKQCSIVMVGKPSSSAAVMIEMRYIHRATVIRVGDWQITTGKQGELVCYQGDATQALTLPLACQQDDRMAAGLFVSEEKFEQITYPHDESMWIENQPDKPSELSEKDFGEALSKWSEQKQQDKKLSLSEMIEALPVGEAKNSIRALHQQVTSQEEQC